MNHCRNTLFFKIRAVSYTHLETDFFTRKKHYAENKQDNRDNTRLIYPITHSSTVIELWKQDHYLKIRDGDL